MKTIKIIFRVILFLLVIYTVWKVYLYMQLEPYLRSKAFKIQRLHDETGLFSERDRELFQEQLYFIYHESDIDIRIVFMNEIRGKTIEEAAVDKMNELKPGNRSREERGVLIIFDISKSKMRIEVGYGLEYYFPDIFVNYLMQDHTRLFFANDNLALGLRLMIRLLHDRIHEAKLGGTFDPECLEILRTRGFLSGGAGATTVLEGTDPSDKKKEAPVTEIEKEDFLPQPTPDETYKEYISWLMTGQMNPDVSLFTPHSRQYLSSLIISKAYFHHILIGEYNKKYDFYIKGDLALQYFTDTPLVNPHFYVKKGDAWQMDIAAEVYYIRGRIGGIFTWDYGGSNDEYTKAFMDKFINIKNYIRIIDGDNRELPIRGPY